MVFGDALKLMQEEEKKQEEGPHCDMHKADPDYKKKTS